jgi:hypothetical protein
MKSLQIFKSMSVFSKRSMLACMIAVGVLSLNSCDKDSIDSVDISSVEASRPPILTNVPPPIISDMEVFTGMTINSQNRVEKYLLNMTPEKAKTINNFKNPYLFSKLPQSEQLAIISEVLGFNNIEEYKRYAQFLNTKKENLAEWVKENSIPTYKLTEQLLSVEKTNLTSKKSARSAFEEIPDNWIDVEAYQGVSPACEEYRACVTGKFVEGVVGSVGAAGGAAAWTSWTGPAGAGAAALGTFLTGLTGTAFVTIYAATFGDCRLKREACKPTPRRLDEPTGYGVDDGNPNLGKAIRGTGGNLNKLTPR